MSTTKPRVGVLTDEHQGLREVRDPHLPDRQAMHDAMIAIELADRLPPRADVELLWRRGVEALRRR